MIGFFHFLIGFFSFQDDSLGWNIFNCVMGILIIGMPLLVILIIIYLIVDAIGFAMAPSQYETGVIVNKYYRPASAHTGIGAGINGNGTVSPVMTQSYDSEIFTIEYESNKDKKKYRIETDQKIFDELNIGDKVKAYYKISKTTQDFEWTGGFEKINKVSK